MVSVVPVLGMKSYIFSNIPICRFSASLISRIVQTFRSHLDLASVQIKVPDAHIAVFEKIPKSLSFTSIC